MAQADLTRRVSFSAARHFRLPHISEEEAIGLYGTDGIHGHDYDLAVTIRGVVDDTTGMVENLDVTKAVIAREVLADLDGHLLNDRVPGFREVAPTLENLIIYIWDRLHGHYGGALLKVTLAEKPTYYAQLESGGRQMYLTRGYHFCAAHRLHRCELSEEENREMFGRCNNRNGHGHNYRLEVTLTGDVDKKSGTLCRVGDLDATVKTKVIEYLDHKNLNVDISEFHDLNPTAENIARIIWDRLSDKPGGAELFRVRVYETELNIADYYGQ